MTQTCMSSQCNGSTEHSCLGYTYSLSHGYHNVTARTDSRARSVAQGLQDVRGLGRLFLRASTFIFPPTLKNLGKPRALNTAVQGVRSVAVLLFRINSKTDDQRRGDDAPDVVVVLSKLALHVFRSSTSAACSQKHRGMECSVTQSQAFEGGQRISLMRVKVLLTFFFRPW